MQKVEIKLARDIADILDAFEIRRVVFIEEQNVPEARERDDYDKEALHILAQINGQPVATARLRWIGKQKMKVERMAILKPHRKKGLGKEILQFMLAYAQSHGVKEVVLHSQWHARGFYAQLGFKSRGKIFMDAGIRHIEMVQRLK
jgi:predicted GNAT family N-acyltransferase